MRWIEAPDHVRQAIVARAQRDEEKRRCLAGYQTELRQIIAEVEALIAAKRAEALTNPSIARRLNRQADTLEEELIFHRSELR